MVELKDGKKQRLAFLVNLCEDAFKLAVSAEILKKITGINIGEAAESIA